MVTGQCKLQQALLLFCVWEGLVRAGSWSIPVLMRDECTSPVPALQLRHGSCFTAQDGETRSHNTSSLGHCCWNLCLWHKEVLVPHLQLMVKDLEGWVDLWITDILCDPGYPDSITQPWTWASAAYMELIKLWPILVHLHSPAHSDQ